MEEDIVDTVQQKQGDDLKGAASLFSISHQFQDSFSSIKDIKIHEWEDRYSSACMWSLVFACLVFQIFFLILFYFTSILLFFLFCVVEFEVIVYCYTIVSLVVFTQFVPFYHVQIKGYFCRSNFCCLTIYWAWSVWSACGTRRRRILL